MSAPRDPARSLRDGLPASAISRELGRRLPAPDLTGPVMSRLGLSRASSRAARRRRIRRSIAQLALVMAVTGTSALCVHLHVRGVEAPGHSGPTIPSAIQHDLEHHGHTINRAIRSIRGLSPWRPVSSPPSPMPMPPDHEETTEEVPEQQARIASRWV
jgi:hypothetical protein